jgi:hypothetical protein
MAQKKPWQPGRRAVPGDAQTWNLNDVVGTTDFTLSSGSIYLRVINNSSAGVRFFRGDETQNTSIKNAFSQPANQRFIGEKMQGLSIKQPALWTDTNW